MTYTCTHCGFEVSFKNRIVKALGGETVMPYPIACTNSECEYSDPNHFHGIGWVRDAS